jgi:hypothetical protein
MPQRGYVTTAGHDAHRPAAVISTSAQCQMLMPAVTLHGGVHVGAIAVPDIFLRSRR